MPENPIIRSVIVGQGRPLVFLHAFPLDHELWRYFQAQGYQLIEADFPGFGLSPLGPEELTMEMAARGLKDHLMGLGITGPVALAGCSMGGYWAMEYVRCFPEGVTHLFLASTRSDLDSPERRDKRLEVAARVLKEGTAWYASVMAEALLGASSRQKDPGMTEWVAQKVRKADPKAVAAAQRAMASRRDQTEFMKTCPIPSRWYVGTEDPNLTLDEVKNMAQGSHKSGYEAFRCGHLIPIEMGKPFLLSMHRMMQGPREGR